MPPIAASATLPETTAADGRTGLAGDAAGLRRAVPRRPGRLRRQRGAARHADRPGPERAGPAVGRQRLRRSPSPGFMLLGGRAADLFGRKRIFLLGLALFTVASLAGGLAQEPWQLIAARDRPGRRRRGARAGHPHHPDHRRSRRARPAPAPSPPGPRSAPAAARWAAWSAGCSPSAVVALGAADQRAGRGAGAGRRGAVAHREPAGRRAAARCAGRAAGDRRARRWWRTGSCRPRRTAGGRASRAAAAGRRAGRDRGVPRRRGARQGPADAAGALPAARGLLGERGDGRCAGAAMFAMWYFLSLYVQNVLGYRPLEAGLSFIPHSLVHRPRLQDRAAADEPRGRQDRWPSPAR